MSQAIHQQAADWLDVVWQERQEGSAPTRPQTAAASSKPRPKQAAKGGFGSTSARPMLTAEKAGSPAAPGQASPLSKRPPEAAKLPKPSEAPFASGALCCEWFGEGFQTTFCGLGRIYQMLTDPC